MLICMLVISIIFIVNIYDVYAAGSGTQSNPIYTTGSRVSGCSEKPVWVQIADYGVQPCYFYSMSLCGSGSAASSGTISKVIPGSSDGTVKFHVYFRGCNGPNDDGLDLKVWVYVRTYNSNGSLVAENQVYYIENSTVGLIKGDSRDISWTSPYYSSHPEYTYSVYVRMAQDRYHDQGQLVGFWLTDLKFGNVAFEDVGSTLHVNPNGGTWKGSTAKQTFRQNSLSTLAIPLPTRTGYTFQGWTKSNPFYGTLPSTTAATTYTFSDKMLVESTITASWKANTYTVNLHKNTPADATSSVQYSGSGWTNKTTYYTKVFTYDSTALPNTSIFSLKGWTLNPNWYSSQNGNNGGITGTAHVPGTKNLTATNNATVNLYVGWTKNSYTIVYSGNDTSKNIYGDTVSTSFTGTTANTPCQYDTNVKLAVNGFSKTGYKFKEWNTKSDGSGTAYSSGQTLIKPNFIETNNGSITLYAIWEPITYKISFENNHGTHHTETSAKDNSYRMSPVSVVRFDQAIKLPKNEYIRKYNVTLKNAEPWLQNLQSSNGNTNSASDWIEYQFAGWNQGSALGTFPYYEVSNTTGLFTDESTVKNLTTTDGQNVILYASWKSNTITLPKTLSGLDNYVFINWSNKPHIDTRIQNKTITDNVDSVNAIINKGTAYKPFADIILYAHWYKDIKLKFNLSNGKYKTNADNIILSSTIYDYNTAYNFDLQDNSVIQSEGKYDTQVNSIDAYGTYNINGENSKYIKISSDGTTYRFLGWSLNPNAAQPDTEFDVFNSSRIVTYTIQNDVQLYAVWEPVLQTNITIDRTLGSLNFQDGMLPDNERSGLDSSDGEQTMSVLIRPGEQGLYRVDSSGSNELSFKIAFDTRITDIYTQGNDTSGWKDNLNPSTTEDLQSDQGHGLNRQITGVKNFTRKFHIPQYLGTESSYDTSNPDKTSVPVNKYAAIVVLSQPSYYYNSVYGKDEQIIININIYISPNNSSNFNNVEDKLPSIISEIRTRIL